MTAAALSQVLLQPSAGLNARNLIEASVHLPHRGRRWIATFRDEAGTQVWKATGLTDRKAAQAIADELEAEAKRKRAAQRGPTRRPVSRANVPFTALAGSRVWRVGLGQGAKPRRPGVKGDCSPPRPGRPEEM
jgi:hypothetical protein